MATEVVADGVDIEEETFSDTSDDDDKREAKILVEFGFTPKDAVALTILCNSEVALELVTDGVDIEDGTFADTSDDDDETKWKILVEFGATPTDAVKLAVLCDSEIFTNLVADGVDIDEETVSDTSDEDDERKGELLVEFGVTPRDAFALTMLCDSEVAKELVTDADDIEDETFADTSDEDGTKGRALVEFGVTPKDAVTLTILCDREEVKELVTDGVDIVEDETFADTSDDDGTEEKILVEFGVTPKDAVALTIPCDGEVAKELVPDGVDIEDETFADTLDDDEREGKILVEFGVKPKDAVARTILCDGEVTKELVPDGVDIEDESFADTLDDDEREGKILVEFGVTPKDAVALTILCDSEVAKELVSDGVDIEDERFADTLDDDETEGKILDDLGVTPRDTVALAELCDNEMVTDVSADCFDVEGETLSDTSDDDKREGKILVEFGVTPKDAVALTILCDSEVAKELVTDGVHIEDKTLSDTTDDDKREGKILVEFSVTPTDAFKLAVLCDREVAKDLVIDAVDIKDETFADTSAEDGKLAVLCDSEIVTNPVTDGVDIEDETLSVTSDDEIEGKLLVEFGVTPRYAVALVVFCDSDMAAEVAADIEDETFADTLDDDKREGEILVELGVTPIDPFSFAVVCDSEMATDVAADCIDIEDETFTDTSENDETEVRTLEKSCVMPRDAVTLAVFCDNEKGKEFVAFCFDTVDEKSPNPADADETESTTLENSCVTPKDAVALTILCDSDVAKELVTNDVHIEDETFAGTSDDDDETKGNILVEFGVTPTDAVKLAVLCDNEMVTEVSADCFDIEDETLSDTTDDDVRERKILVELGVTPKDAVALTILCESEVAKELVPDGVDMEDETFADTSDDDETEGKILVEFSVTPTDAVKLAVLCDSAVAKDLVIDGADIEDETSADTSDEDGTKGRILVELGLTPTDAVKLAVLCDSEIVTNPVTAGVDIEDETLSVTSDDEIEGELLVGFGVTPRDAVALAVLCDSDMATEVAADIEDETLADTLNDDVTEVDILVEFGVTPRDPVSLSVVCDSEMATDVAADCIDIEDETFTDTSENDETDDRALEKSCVMPRDAVALAVFCDSEKGKEFVAFCFDTVDEKFRNPADADETESTTLENSCVMPKDAVELVVLCDTEMFSKRVGGSFDMEDDIFTNTANDGVT